MVHIIMLVCVGAMISFAGTKTGMCTAISPNVGLCIEIETLNIRYVVFGLQVIHIAQCKPFGYGTGKRVLHISVLSNGSTGDNCALNVLPAPEAMPKLLLRFL